MLTARYYELHSNVLEPSIEQWLVFDDEVTKLRRISAKAGDLITKPG
jgi:hypothetical protein